MSTAILMRKNLIGVHRHFERACQVSMGDAMQPQAKSEDLPTYVVTPGGDDDAIIAKALEILESRMRRGEPLSSPAAVRDYLKVKLAGLEHEEFHILFLDAQHRVIALDAMFRGTLTQTSVYPREVVKQTLAHNAGAVILAHNHPSGVAEPSVADKLITKALKNALELVDVRVLDHIVVGGTNTVSFAERGLI